MIGIYGVTGGKFDLKRFLSGSSTSKVSFNYVKNHLGSFGIVYSNFNAPYAVAKDLNDWIFIDGFVFDDDGKQIFAANILKESKNNKSYLQNLNGEFLILAKLHGELFLINDIMGQRQHSYAYSKIGSYSVSPSPGLALKILGEPKKINDKSLFTFITTKKLRFNRETIWQNCEVLEPGCIFNIDRGGFHKTKYWNLIHTNKTKCFNTDKFIDIFKKAVNSRILTKNVGITLTGGLDSRSIIGAIDNDKLPSLKAFTMGVLDCEEVLVASNVAKTLNVKFCSYDITPEKVFEKTSLEYFIDEDIELIIQGLWSPFSKSVNDSDYLLHGLDFGATLGGFDLPEKLVKIKSTEDFYNFALTENLRFNEDMIFRLFKKEKLDEIGLDLGDYIKKSVIESEGNNFIEKYDSFVMKYSMNRVILQRYRGIRNYIETLSPMYDRNVLNYIFSLDVKERVFYKAFYPFINQLSKKLAELPYQRTNLPANVSVKFWKNSQKIEKDREELCREIARDSGGKDFVPYTRYYTNVDEWMRFNSKWMLAIKDLLQSDNSIIRREWLNSDYVDKIIFDHQNHVKSNFGVIQTLMSAEVFLRLEKNITFNMKK
ncbi:asparagine synthase-related protein [Akkermansiaceae bacterium]|nr:asparagine synthase-related protein [Akkermansiaceae bacterium]